MAGQRSVSLAKGNEKIDTNSCVTTKRYGKPKKEGKHRIGKGLILQNGQQGESL